MNQHVWCRCIDNNHHALLIPWEIFNSKEFLNNYEESVYLNQHDTLENYLFLQNLNCGHPIGQSSRLQFPP